MNGKLKENYKSWDVDIENICNFNTTENWIKQLLRFAVLAPSSHNSQPWLFKIKNNVIEVYRNKKKELKVGDVENRFQYISVGCAIQNIKIAADYYNIPISITYFPHENDELVAFITLLKTTGVSKKDRKHLIYQIPKRSTNRDKYKDKDLPEEFFEKVKKYQNTFPEMAINWISDQENRKTIGELSSKAGSESMTKPGFLKELSGYIKNNLTKSKYGIPAFGMSLPTPISFLVPFIIKWVNMDKLNEKKNIELFEKFTKTIGIISSKSDTKKEWVVVGEFYQLIALIAEEFNLKTSVWGAPIILRTYAKKIQKLISIANEPQFVFRVGYITVNQPHSPRYLLHELLKN